MDIFSSVPCNTSYTEAKTVLLDRTSSSCSKIVALYVHFYSCSSPPPAGGPYYKTGRLPVLVAVWLVRVSIVHTTRDEHTHRTRIHGLVCCHREVCLNRAWLGANISQVSPRRQDRQAALSPNYHLLCYTTNHQGLPCNTRQPHKDQAKPHEIPESPETSRSLRATAGPFLHAFPKFPF